MYLNYNFTDKTNIVIFSENQFYKDGSYNFKAAQKIVLTENLAQTKKEYLKAVNYFKMHLKTVNDDIEVILLLGQCYILSNQFLDLANFSELNLQLYPTQPQLYYYSGLANNQQKKYTNAKDALETGIDFIVDDLPLQINFYIQLGEAFAGLQDIKNKEFYFNKANELLKKIKK